MNSDLSQLITKESQDSKILEELQRQARAWRDAELARADIELNKVQDGVGKGTVAEWRTYRINLRNWPATTEFPNVKPVAPDAKE